MYFEDRSITMLLYFQKNEPAVQMLKTVMAYESNSFWLAFLALILGDGLKQHLGYFSA